MHPTTRLAIALASASFTNGATATGLAVDTAPPGIRARSLTLDVVCSSADVVSNTPSVIKLQHSDTTDSTNFSDITEFVGGGVGGFVVPNALTSAGAHNVFRFNVDLRGRRRYVRPIVSPRTTMTIFATANLGRLEQAPYNAAKANVLALVEG
jgi:hypothetical protein